MREGNYPLRTILQNFINHVDSLKDEDYEEEFQELKQLTENLKSCADYSCVEGEKEVNRKKNRYKDILPYDYSRVVISSIPGVPGSDYVNANYIRGASGSRAYIASQGPLPHTVPDFWRMVVECEVQVIIMASNETEGGKHKCEYYWVSETEETKQFGNVSVSFVKSRQVCPDFLVRTLKIKYADEENGKVDERTICQFHYILWPDHGVPDTVKPLLDMVRLVRDCQASETLPVLVHCSAGCGRTGTICAIDYVWGLLRTGHLLENVDLFGIVKEMRRQRVAMVQTKEQYVLLHNAVKELFKERLKVIDAHPYENISKDGVPFFLQDKENDYEELYLYTSPEENSSFTFDEHKISLPMSDTFPRAAKSQSSLHGSLERGKLKLPGMPPLPSKQAKISASLPNSPLSAQVFDNSYMDSCSQNFINEQELTLHKISNNNEVEQQNFALSQQLHSCNSSPYNSPVMTPSVTPNSAQPSGINTSLVPPTPPPRSRTPSPIVAIHRSMECLTSEIKPHNKTLLPSREGVLQNSQLFTLDPVHQISKPIRKPALQKHNKWHETPTVPRDSSDLIGYMSSDKSCNFNCNSENQNSFNKFYHPHKLDTSTIEEFSDRIKQLSICPPPPPLLKEKINFLKNGRYSPEISYSKFKNYLENDSHENKNKFSKTDDRPALPVKKSKSFRYNRPVGLSMNKTGNSSVSKKNVSDINTYFSLERNKGELPFYRSESSSSITERTSKSIPKLSLFNAIESTYKLDDILPINVGAQEILQKRNSEKRMDSALVGFDVNLEKNRLDQLSGNLCLVSQMADSCTELKHSALDLNALDIEKSEPTSLFTLDHANVRDELSDFDVLKLDESLGECSLDGAKDYVNARVVRSPSISSKESPRYLYVPLPVQRTSKEKSFPQYVNCAVGSNTDISQDDFNEVELYAKPDYEHIAPKYYRKSTDTLTEETCNAYDVHRESETAKYKKSSDYEIMDFGDGSMTVDDVFESVNFELLDLKKKLERNELTNKERLSQYYSENNLDPIAKQVYFDCEEYLLHGTSRSPVPSLMPKNVDVKKEVHADVEDVKSKVNVLPQGLRNRERRHSYRQAVNSVLHGDIGSVIKRLHKHDEIWPNNDNVKSVLNKNKIKRKGIELQCEFPYKEKLNDNSLVAYARPEEYDVIVTASPGYADDDIISRDSSSTNSTLQSRSTQSSNSSESKRLPVKNKSWFSPKNIAALPHKTNYYERIEMPLRKDGVTQSQPLLEKSARLHSFVDSSSMYGTIATSNPYHVNVHSNKVSSTSLKSSSKSVPSTSTLPFAYHIPPPKEFEAFPSAAFLDIQSNELINNSSKISLKHKHYNDSSSNLANSCFKVGSISSSEIHNHQTGIKYDASGKETGGKLSSHPFYQRDSGSDSVSSDTPVAPPRVKKGFSAAGTSQDSLEYFNFDGGASFIKKQTLGCSEPAPVLISSLADKIQPSLIQNPLPPYIHPPPPKLVKSEKQLANKKSGISPLNSRSYTGNSTGFLNTKCHSEESLHNNAIFYGMEQTNAVSVINGNATEGSISSSSDDGLFHKFSVPLFKKFKTKNTLEGITLKSSFFTYPESKVAKESKREYSHSSPTSPKPLAKAFGKIRMGSKTVAANFRSYLNLRNDRAPAEGPIVFSKTRLQKSFSSNSCLQNGQQGNDFDVVDAKPPPIGTKEYVPPNYLKSQVRQHYI